MRGAQISFTCIGKEDELKTLTAAPQCYFRGRMLVYDRQAVEIQTVLIGMEAVPGDYSTEEQVRWPTAQPFETITMVVKCKRKGESLINVIGDSKKIERVEI